MRPDICLSIGNVNYDKIQENLKKVNFAEIRIDLLDLSQAQMESIFKSHKNLIATYHKGRCSEEQRQKLLINALEFGAAYVDVDIDTDAQWREPIISLAQKLSRKVIVSFHNYKKTPEVKELNRLVDLLFASGADIAKLACMVNSPEDNARILGLYAIYENIVAIGMGTGGIISRVVAPLLGAPFTYASIPGIEIAQGQLDENQLRTVIDFLEIHTGGKK